jgi:hypothetical protein
MALMLIVVAMNAVWVTVVRHSIGEVSVTVTVDQLTMGDSSARFIVANYVRVAGQSGGGSGGGDRCVWVNARFDSCSVSHCSLL